MWVTTYWVLGFFSGDAPERPQVVSAPDNDEPTDWYADRRKRQIEQSNSAAIQFMVLAALTLEEVS